MKSTQTKTLLVTGLVAVLSLWLLPMLAGGKVEISSSPRPMIEHCGAGDSMKGWRIWKREGYTQSFIVDSEENQTLLTVPEGERFVLLRLYIQQDYDSPHNVWIPWKLTVDDRLWLYASNMFYPISDFPEGCVVVNGGETLKVIRGKEEDILAITLIGYFQRDPQPAGIKTNR